MSDTYSTRTKRGLDIPTAAELGDLLHELADPANKEARALLAKAIKKVKPNSSHAAAFTDIDVEERFEQLREEQAQQRIKDQQAEVLREMNAKRSRLLSGDEKGRKYSEDDVKNIESLMMKKGISDYDDGAVLYAATLPPSDPKPTGGPDNPPDGTWEIPDLDKYASNPWKAGREQANAVIGEFMRKRG